MVILIKPTAFNPINSFFVSLFLLAHLMVFSLAFGRKTKILLRRCFLCCPIICKSLVFNISLASAVKGPWSIIRRPICCSDFQRRKLNREFRSLLDTFRSQKVSQGNVNPDLKICGLLFLFQANCLCKLLANT